MSTAESLKSRINHVLAETKTSQAAFAMAAGMDLERLRNMCAGKIKTLRADEARNIRTAYGYRELWLREGKGPETLSAEEKKAQPTLDDISASTAVKTTLGVFAPAGVKGRRGRAA